jgi:hypothetical protein
MNINPPETWSREELVLTVTKLSSVKATIISFNCTEVYEHAVKGLNTQGANPTYWAIVKAVDYVNARLAGTLTLGVGK